MSNRIWFLCVRYRFATEGDTIVYGFFKVGVDLGYLYYCCGRMNKKKRLTKKMALDYIDSYEKDYSLIPTSADSDESFLDYIYDGNGMKFKIINSYEL